MPEKQVCLLGTMSNPEGAPSCRSHQFLFWGSPTRTCPNWDHQALSGSISTWRLPFWGKAPSAKWSWLSLTGQKLIRCATSSLHPCRMVNGHMVRVTPNLLYWEAVSCCFSVARAEQESRKLCWCTPIWWVGGRGRTFFLQRCNTKYFTSKIEGEWWFWCIL